jgi:hypothetical protein
MNTVENAGSAMYRNSKMYIEKIKYLETIENAGSRISMYKIKKLFLCTLKSWNPQNTSSIFFKKFICLNMYKQKNLLISNIKSH